VECHRVRPIACNVVFVGRNDIMKLKAVGYDFPLIGTLRLATHHTDPR
jgi:hypothetical protein